MKPEIKSSALESTDGKILPPLILWMLGVPGIIVLLLWAFVFKG